MLKTNHLCVFLSCFIFIAGCQIKSVDSKVLGDKSSHTTKYAPNDGEFIMIIGQDLGSVRGYTQSNCCPEPGGVTTYIGLYNIFDKGRKFGGMGIDDKGNPLDYYADWGGGISSLYSLIQEYPNSAIAVGLSMTENQHPGGLSHLVEGKYDSEIKHLVNLIKTHSKPVYLRIGYEFDGMWNAGYNNHKNYINAYRRIVDHFPRRRRQ